MIDLNEEESQRREKVEIKWNPVKKLLGMRREAPEFRRCCCCIPLRRGLIGWGYIKVALDIAVLGLMGFLLAFLGAYVLLFVEVLFLVVDTAFNILLIVGGHQKNIKFLKITYVYSLVSLVLLVLSFCWFAYTDIALAVRLISADAPYKFILAITLPGFSAQFLTLATHMYWILLIRSVMIKLREESIEIQYTNPSTAEAQCTVHNLSANNCTGQIIAVSYLILILHEVGSQFNAKGLAILLGVLSFLVANVVFSIVFVIGGHKKNYKFLRIYYSFGIFALAITIVVFLVLITLQIVLALSYESEVFTAYLMATDTSIVTNILLDIYFTILIRSEILKLKKSRVYFINNARTSSVVLDLPMQEERERGCDAVYTDSESEEEVTPNKPLFPTQELEKLKTELEHRRK